MNDLEIFCGSVSSMEARVYARLPRPDDGDWRLTGHIRGPRCKFTRTLPATATLSPRDGGATLLAEAVLTDPCFWTPELPLLYDVRVELHRNGALVEAVERPLAIRPLQPQGANLIYAGRRWVLRGVAQRTCHDSAIEEWRHCGAAMFVSEPDKELARAAAELGVLLVVPIGGSNSESVSAAMRRWSSFPAVAIVAVNVAAIDAEGVPRGFHTAPMNLLLAAHCRNEDPPAAVLARAHLVLYESSDAEVIGRFAASCPRPVIGFRPAGNVSDVASARAACDALQRDVAPLNDLAGYIV